MRKAIAVLPVLVFIVFFSGCVSFSEVLTCDVCGYTPSQAIGKFETLGNRNVTINGNMEKADCKCSQQECPAEEPCCQTCSCQLAFVSENAKIIVKGAGCSGTNCGTACDIEPAAKVKLRGLFTQLDSYYYLEVK